MFLIRHRCPSSEARAPIILCKQFLVFLRYTQLPEKINDRILTESYFSFYFFLVASNQNKIYVGYTYDYGHRRTYIYMWNDNFRIDLSTLLDYTITVENDDFISNQTAISIVQIIIS